MTTTMPNEALDDAYERLSNTGPEFEGWLTNHGPMAADALIRIGHEERLTSWVEDYKSRLDERPGERWRFDESEWQELLGDASRLGDWLALFERQLQDEGWRDVLARWWPRLIPGAVGGATHGLIRTGHAVRAILETESKPRVAELGQALGYWAARWQAAPGSPRLLGPNTYGAAMDRLPSLDLSGGARTRLLRLRDEPRWSSAVASAREPLDSSAVPDAINEVTDEAVRRYLHWGQPNAVMLVHAATAPRAAALALPALPTELWRMTFGHVWAASTAILAAYRPADGLSADIEPQTIEQPTVATSPEALAGRAAEHGDEHVIKLAEVAIEAHGRGVSEALAAGMRAVELIAPEQ